MDESGVKPEQTGSNAHTTPGKVVVGASDDSIIDIEARDAIQDEADAIGTQREYESVTPPASFVTRYVEYASQRTDAPCEAHELMAVGLLSALAGPKPRLPIATTINGWNLCLWTMYIVDSTVGRKSSVIDYASDIAAEVIGPDGVLHWEGSPQGIIQRLQSRDGQPAVFVRDEYSGLLAQMNRGGHMAGLAQTFIRTYDGRPLENIRTKKKDKETGEYEDDTDRVNQPYLAKLCASTWESFTTRATIDNVLDGFLARFIVFTGSSTASAMRLASPELAGMRRALLTQAETFHKKAQVLGDLGIEDIVMDLAWALEQDLMKQANRCSRPDAAVPALKRLSESVMKTAALLAIDATPGSEVPKVTAIHFEQARRIGVRWINSTLKLIDALGRTSFQKNCQGVLASVRTNLGGMRVRDLYRKHAKLNMREFNEVLLALQTQDEIQVSDGPSARGPASRWVIATRRAS
jgi:hypothetical protein